MIQYFGYFKVTIHLQSTLLYIVFTRFAFCCNFCDNVITNFTLFFTQIARFMGPTWGPPGSCRPQMGPMLAPWTLLSGQGYFTVTGVIIHCLGVIQTVLMMMGIYTTWIHKLIIQPKQSKPQKKHLHILSSILAVQKSHMYVRLETRNICNLMSHYGRVW